MRSRQPTALAVQLLLLGLVTAGCGRDPILDQADELAQGEGGSPGDQGGGGVPGAVPVPGAGEAPPPGQAAEPAPGSPADPPPGQATAPLPGTPEAGVGAGDVPRVAVRGEVTLPDYRIGTVKIDAFDGDQKNLDGPRPSVIGVLELDAPGSFELMVPVGTEEVWIGAHVDEDMDGRPNPQEPSAWYVGNPVEIGADGADGVVLELQRAPPPPQHGL